MDREKVIKGLENCLHYKGHCLDCPYSSTNCQNDVLEDAIELLKEQEGLLKHEYWRGYNNGRADERGLQDGTIMQTFSPD